jgi:DUF2075 family protein
LLSETSAAEFRAPLSVALDVHTNGELVVSEQNLIKVAAFQSKAEESGDVDMEHAERVEGRIKRLAKALDVTGDLGIWGEWLRREVTKIEKEV